MSGMMRTRRDFIKLAGGALATGLASNLAPAHAAQTAPPHASGKTPLIWGNLIHLSYNMWCDRMPDAWGNHTKEQLHHVMVSDRLRFDESLYNDILKRMKQAGMNMIVIDLGDAIQYESHPEIAVKGAWSQAKLKAELKKMREMGLEPIPKLNFSAGHDQWLHDYSRMVSTPTYYKVCRELIEETVQLFDKPRFFHLGYDEETFGNQSKYAIAIVRQHELWWHDFNFFVEAVEKTGSRPWIWSDFAWTHPQEFYEKMPKSVLQSNWYYGMRFDRTDDPKVKTFLDLEKHGFDQVPTGSNWTTADNFEALVKWCRPRIGAERLKGFLQTPWQPTVEEFRSQHMEAIDVVGKAIAKLG